MKFTKEDANKELVARLTASGENLHLSQRSINEQIETLLALVANDEMEVSEFVDKVWPVVKTADTNVRNDVSQGIKEYKDANPVKPTVTQTTTATQQQNNGVDKDLLARLEALEKKNQESELALRKQSIKTNLSSKMKELGIKNDKWIEAMVGNVNITDDFNVDAQAESYLNLYNSMQADFNPDVTPHGTGGSRQDYTANAIKMAAELAKSQNLIG